MSADGMGLPEMKGETPGELLRQHLGRLYPLNQLSAEALSRLMPALRVMRYPPKTQLYSAGESPDDIFYVLKGCVCLYDKGSSVPQLKIGPPLDDEAIPLPLAIPSGERALVVENSVILQIDRALLAQATQRNHRSPNPVRSQPAPSPAASPRPAVATQPARTVNAGSAPENGTRVLVVEHQAAEAGACRALVRALGLQADWVSSAEEAVELLQVEHYGAVLLDMQLPGGDGFDVVKLIHTREPGAPRTRIIAVTEASHDDRKGCVAAGIDDVICKPLSAISLRAKLGRLNPSRPQPATA